MVEEEDFFEVTWAYLQTVAAQNVVHTEMFFDPQVHTLRGVMWPTFMPGFLRAIRVRCALRSPRCRVQFKALNRNPQSRGVCGPPSCRSPSPAIPLCCAKLCNLDLVLNMGP